MALVNTILIDLSSSTASLNSTQSAVSVESISYDNVTNQITFNAIPGATVSGADFLILLQQFVIYETAILANYHSNQFISTPFTKIDTTEQFISFTNAWTLVILNHSGTTIISDYAAQGSGQVTLAARASPITVSFPEWIYILQQLLHYQSSVKQFLGL